LAESDIFYTFTAKLKTIYMMDRLVGRKREQEVLQGIMESGSPEFLVVLWKAKGWENIFNQAVF
jgi:hypothetical protein